MLEYKCRACKKAYGPLGVHSGKYVAACGSCRDFMVIGSASGPCPSCKGACERFSARCPSCGSKDLYYRDSSLPGEVRIWMRCAAQEGKK